MPDAATTGTRQQRGIAPYWHTALLIITVLGFSLAGSIRTAHHAPSQRRVLQYLITLAWEWLLAAFVFWGIRMRCVPLRQLLGQRRSGWRDWRDDILLATAFWIAASMVLAAIGTILKLGHLSTPEKTLVQLAPANAFEFTLWILLSISAGICEELTFRGYLVQQFAGIGNRLWFGVLASSLLFGLAHGYEGASGIIAITVYGAMFCVLAIRRRSLRPGMIAHAWHDIFSGAALMLLRHSHLL